MAKLAGSAEACRQSQLAAESAKQVSLDGMTPGSSPSPWLVQITVRQFVVDALASRRYAEVSVTTASRGSDQHSRLHPSAQRSGPARTQALP